MIEAIVLGLIVVWCVVALRGMNKRVTKETDPNYPPGYDDWHRPQYPETIAGNNNSGYDEYMKSFDRW